MSKAETVSGAQGLLDTVYDELGYRSERLKSPVEDPSAVDDETWQSLGEWLSLGSRVGADRIFFVGDDPVVVFARLPEEAGEEEVVAAYRRAWSLGRARCLFLASEDELRVYALTSPPPRGPDDAAKLRPIEVVQRSADVIETLASYHRDRVESGSLFTEHAFRSDGRADDSLLRDVEAATEALVGQGLPRRVAHALIERVILIRYLEDRNVVTPKYFEEIANQRKNWQRDFGFVPVIPAYGADSTFVRCLSSLQLTRAAFQTLAEDFNGDLFAVASDELELVTADHLNLIQRLLTGEGLTSQAPLFLWAYDFSVVPTALISSMYERFYRAEGDDQSSTHYTPQELVEFVTAQVLTDDCLSLNPTVCDPACGSGIFLVEAYRRIVRHEMVFLGRRLTTSELRELLMTRIAGIDINAEAVRLAAFSLYLAFLSYQSPPDIRRAGPLPHLIEADRESDRSVLRISDAFADVVEADSATSDEGRATPATAGYDVVIGNPPWDEPPRQPATLSDRWARANGRTVGDRNPSQLFLWRGLSLLKPDGVAALLVNATAFHNTRATSKQFRRQFVRSVRLQSIVNFSSARHTFFDGAVAPFMLVTFLPKGSGHMGAVSFRTVRPSETLRSSKSMAFASIDRRWVQQQALAADDYLWKVYAWGSHRDAAFMRRLELEKSVMDMLPSEPKPGYGYQRGRGVPSEYLAELPSLKSFEPWGTLDKGSFEAPPRGVKRQPDERLYSGQRILLRRGIRVGFGPRSRLVTEPMSFRHTTYCVPLQNLDAWQAKLIWATLLSSLGRYSMFMRSGSWGLWHDSVYGDEILEVPIRLPSEPSPVTARIVAAVDSLVGDVDADNIFAPEPGDEIPAAIREIDEAVFELFDLSADEAALVNDFHRYLLGFAGGRAELFGSTHLPPHARGFGTARNVEEINAEPLRSYIDRFLRSWNARLSPDGALSWRVVTAPQKDLVAVIFETYTGNPPVDTEAHEAWASVMSRMPVGLDRNERSLISPESFLRVVTDTSIIIIKRDRPRFWSSSAAAEDAEATLLQAMKLNA